MLFTTVLMLLGAAAQAQTPDEKDKPKLLVNDLAAHGVPPAQAVAMTEAIVATLTGRGLFKVVSSQDVRELLGVERQRQILGACGDDGEQCGVDLGSAAAARFVLSGSLSRLGATFQLSLQMLDTQKSKAVARATRLAADLETLRALLPYAVAEATGSPLPPPASRVVQSSMVATGSALLLGGGVYGMLALSRQAVLNDELCPGGAVGDRCSGSALRPREFYLAQDAALGTQKTTALLLMAVGAALAGAGLYLMPPPEGGPRVALVPSGGGLALVGVWP